ncbi:hypothetical protein FM106_30250 [Brachybacterium faecium]|nr:hypothetical protein FM106_30250 [Brachybacterium faecium]
MRPCASGARRGGPQRGASPSPDPSASPRRAGARAAVVDGERLRRSSRARRGRAGCDGARQDEAGRGRALQEGPRLRRARQSGPGSVERGVASLDVDRGP